MRAQWEDLDDSEQARYPYQKELKRRMDGFMSDLEKKLQRNTERLAAQEVPVVSALDQASPPAF